MKDTMNAADFNAKLAALIDAANTAAPKSKEFYAASDAIADLFIGEGKALERKYNRLPKGFALLVQTQYYTRAGKVYKGDMFVGLECDWKKVPAEWRFAFKGYDGLDSHWKIFARYRTPAQVEAVIRMLKAAIKRGDTEFKFPTIKQVERAAE